MKHNATAAWIVVILLAMITVGAAPNCPAVVFLDTFDGPAGSSAINSFWTQTDDPRTGGGDPLLELNGAGVLVMWGGRPNFNNVGVAAISSAQEVVFSEATAVDSPDIQELRFQGLNLATQNEGILIGLRSSNGVVSPQNGANRHYWAEAINLDFASSSFSVSARDAAGELKTAGSLVGSQAYSGLANGLTDVDGDGTADDLDVRMVDYGISDRAGAGTQFYIIDLFFGANALGSTPDFTVVTSHKGFGGGGALTAWGFSGKKVGFTDGSNNTLGELTFVSVTLPAVPEPSTVLLLTLGGLWVFCRRRKME